MNQPHSKPLFEIYRTLEATPGGLSSAEAAKRLISFGYNRLEAQKSISPWRLLLEQFKNVLIITLLIATAISAFLGHGIEAIAIAVIVLFAVLLGFIQEYRAEKAIEALKKMAAPTAKVLRDGKVYEGKWIRSGRREPFRIVDGAGKDIPLKPGNSWWQVVPPDLKWVVAP